MEDIYVVVDLGNSHATVAAAQREADNKLKILATEQEEYKIGSMKNGLVQKSDDVAARVSSIITKLSNKLGEPIHSYYVGLNCHTLRTRFYEVSRVFELGKFVTADDVEELKMLVRNNVEEDVELFGEPVITCLWDDELDDSLIGRSGGTLKVKMAVASVRKAKKSLNDTCLSQLTRYKVAGVLNVPESFGEAITTADDREVGCLTIDFAATCTSIAVYKDGKLLNSAVIPLGGLHITHDLESLGLTTIEAEKVKKKCDALANDSILKMGDKQVDSKDVAKYARARLDEILAFVMQQANLVVDKKELKAGIFATGGVKRMKNFVKIVSDITEMEVHEVKYNDCFTAEIANEPNMNARLAGMLLKATQNCCGEQKKTETAKKGRGKNIWKKFTDYTDNLFGDTEQ